ncbi:enoyl hydratase domain protein [Fusarium subglutinans]|uniref:Enoyl-CoA hydratase domain-containing protein 3, mitochondrial n=1 Tax=Gibberella subglutinans TaxID=42677 RepID=A0A8H5PJV8_GIBSU|nr:enoyl hydratase domain protein [Fusarium subglutinans]KAF5597636.1 enoyl hydratase domain protein [Fusarium subglutinans]
MPFPKLPPRAAYIKLSNPTKRNALSIPVLRDLKSQLDSALSLRPTQRKGLLPKFSHHLLQGLEEASKDPTSKQWKRWDWLVSASEWKKQRAGAPDVLVLRSEGPVFSSGHDLQELSKMSRDDVKTLFELCSEVMTTIRRSPVPIVCPIQGLATAAGFQLAMSTDFPIALPDTQFALPGAKIGLPCTSPSTAVSRRFPAATTYRLLATAEPIKASDYPDVIDVVRVPPGEDPEEAFEKRVAAVVERLLSMSPQQQAVGKWAYWSQFGFGKAKGDGYEQASQWAGRVMALHARSEDAKEGIAAFLEKREPVWISSGAHEAKETAVDVDAPAAEVTDSITEDAASSTEADATATAAGESTAESQAPEPDVDRPITTDRS